MNLIYLEQKPDDHGRYRVYYQNGKHLGDMERGDDGYYAWWPMYGGGYWDSASLRAIADKLVELNANWDAIIQKEIGNER